MCKHVLIIIIYTFNFVLTNYQHDLTIFKVLEYNLFNSSTQLKNWFSRDNVVRVIDQPTLLRHPAFYNWHISSEH